MRACVAFLAAAAIAAGLSGAAHAAIPYSTDFEQPAFVPGPLQGQGGWNVYSATNQLLGAQVTGAVAHGGTQSLSVNNAVNGQTGGWYDFGGVGAPATVEMSGDIMVQTLAAPSEWQFATLGAGLVPFGGGIDWQNGQITAITAGFPVIGTFTANTWHHVDIFSDVQTQMFQVFLDGGNLGSFAFCGDNGPCGGAHVGSLSTGLFDTFGGATGAFGFGFLDNFAVNVIIPSSGTPEPATWALALTGFALAGATLRRRRAIA